MRSARFIQKVYLKPLLAWVICSLALTVEFSMAAPSVDQKKLLWYDSWVTQFPNDSPPAMSIDDPVELKKAVNEMAAAAEDRRQRIKRDPGILPYLKALFWMHHRHPENNSAGGVKSLLEAMTLVPDLVEADVTDITAEVERQLAEPFSGYDGDKDNYLLKFWMPTLAVHFPSVENIERCARIIGRSDTIRWRFPKLIGLQVLSRIGTAEWLPLAEQTEQWMERMSIGAPEGDFPQVQAAEAKQLVEAMRARLAAAPPDKPEVSPPAAKSPPTPENPPLDSPIVSQPPGHSGLNPFWFALGLLLLPVIFLLQRKKP